MSLKSLNISPDLLLRYKDVTVTVDIMQSTILDQHFSPYQVCHSQNAQECEARDSDDCSETDC